MQAQFPHRAFEYQLVLENGDLDEARGCDDREIFDLECEDLIGVLDHNEQLILFEHGKAIQVWEVEGGVPVCNDIKEN